MECRAHNAAPSGSAIEAHSHRRNVCSERQRQSELICCRLRDGCDEECVIDTDYAVPAMSTSHDYWEALYRKRDAVSNPQVSTDAIEPCADLPSGTSMADFLTLMDAPVDDPRIDLDIPTKVSPVYSPVEEVQNLLPACNGNEDKHYKVVN